MGLEKGSQIPTDCEDAAADLSSYMSTINKELESVELDHKTNFDQFWRKPANLAIMRSRRGSVWVR